MKKVKQLSFTMLTGIGLTLTSCLSFKDAGLKNINQKLMRKIYKAFAIIVFIAALPLIAIEIMIKRSGNFTSQIQSSFHLMLFVVELGGQKPLPKK